METDRQTGFVENEPYDEFIPRKMQCSEKNYVLLFRFSVIKMITLALWHLETEMRVINIEWLNWLKTAGTSAAWRSTMTMSSSSPGTATEGPYIDMRDSKRGDRGVENERRKKKDKKMKGRDIGRDGNRRYKRKLLSSSLRHHLFILISTQRHWQQLKRYRCLFLAWPFFTRTPRQNADTGINTNTPHGDSGRQSHQPFLPSLFSHMPLSTDTCTRSSHWDLWEQHQHPVLTSRSVQLWLFLTVTCYTGVKYF